MVALGQPDSIDILHNQFMQRERILGAPAEYYR